MSATRDYDSNGAQGPTWDDVYVYLAYLSGLGNGRVFLRLGPEMSVGSCGYYRIELWMDGLPHVLGEGGFGEHYAPGSRTMAGAAFAACIKGEETLVGAQNFTEPAMAPRKRRKTKKA